jgi:hypothetical protein
MCKARLGRLGGIVALFDSFTPSKQERRIPAERIFCRFKASAHLQKRFSGVLKRSARVQEVFSADLKLLHTCRKDFLSF